MKRIGFLLVVLALSFGVAFAGTQRKNSGGAAPSAATDGVSILDAVGCQMSIGVDAGGDIAAGCKLVPYVFDSAQGATWMEADSTLVCTTTNLLDGGMRSSYPCPDTPIVARVGRMAVQKVNCLGADGGTGKALFADAGTGPEPVVSLKCWGPKVVPAGP